MLHVDRPRRSGKLALRDLSREVSSRSICQTAYKSCLPILLLGQWWVLHLQVAVCTVHIAMLISWTLLSQQPDQVGPQQIWVRLTLHNLTMACHAFSQLQNLPGRHLWRIILHGSQAKWTVCYLHLNTICTVFNITPLGGLDHQQNLETVDPSIRGLLPLSPCNKCWWIVCRSSIDLTVAVSPHVPCSGILQSCKNLCLCVFNSIKSDANEGSVCECKLPEIQYSPYFAGALQINVVDPFLDMYMDDEFLDLPTIKAPNQFPLSRTSSMGESPHINSTILNQDRISTEDLFNDLDDIFGFVADEVINLAFLAISSCMANCPKATRHGGFSQ